MTRGAVDLGLYAYNDAYYGNGGSLRGFASYHVSEALVASQALTDAGALTDTAASVHAAVDALADSAAATDTATGEVIAADGES